MSEEMKNCKVCGLSVLNRIHSDAAFGHKFEPQAVTVPGDLRLKTTAEQRVKWRTFSWRGFEVVIHDLLNDIDTFIERLGAAEQRHIDICTKLNLALNERDRLKEQLAEMTKNRDQWERNSSAENQRAGDAAVTLRYLRTKVAELEGKLAQIQAEALSAAVSYSAAHDAQVRRETLEELLEALDSKSKTLWSHNVQPNWDDAKTVVRALIGDGA